MSQSKYRQRFPLQDHIPLLREIFLFDPTYHLLFQKWVLGVGAMVFSSDPKTFVIIPYGIYQKVEDELYCVLKVKIKGSISQNHPIIVNHEFLYQGPYSMYVQFYFCPRYWKKIVTEYTTKWKHEQSFLSRKSYLALYTNSIFFSPPMTHLMAVV